MAQTEVAALDSTVTVTPAAATDYLFRGISQTRNRPAGQLTVDVEHSSGVYIGGFLSNVAFVGTNARQELDGSAGYRFALGDLKLDLGATYYGYPGYSNEGSSGAPGRFNANPLDFFEAIARANYTVGPAKLLGTVAYSPGYFGDSGTGWYIEGGVDLALPYEFTLSGRLGYQWIQNNVQFGAPDYLNFGVSVSREVYAGFILSVGYYGTDVSETQCGGLKVCNNRFMAALSRPF
ncbi:TorF family putative porin [Humitalea sp. 24SJ18S-53]|uniref:TorF family putative porin n=1 Tax=Humitalea sp. 24SJ18S-53 TaxID=3422307 RepID=UPI003D669F49